MKICVVGLGYIGLPTAAMLAESGHEVVGYDADPAVIAAITNGCTNIAEAPVKELVLHSLAKGRLMISTAPYPSDTFIICVQTPTIDHRPDLTAVERAFAQIAPLAQDGNLILLESTVPPGTTERIAEKAFTSLGRGLDAIYLAHCPERVLPGNIVAELRWNDRVVGGRREMDAEVAKSVYASFARGNIHTTSLQTAETVKLIENTFRDVNIAFANELAMLCEELGVDAWKAIELANCHPRVNILSPGPGVGGHCIPVDPQFLSDAHPFATELIQTARRVNERMPHLVAKRVIERVRIGRHVPKIALLGAAYKADVDDARETPTRVVERLLAERGYDVVVYDPLVQRYDGRLASDLGAAVNGAEAIVVMTAHARIKALHPSDVSPRMRARFILDTRNVIDVEAWSSAGFDVHILGRGRFDACVLAAAV